MSGFSPRALRSFEIARQVFDLLAANAVESAVIGSVALAVHGYVRATRDLDLGVTILSVRDLRRVADALRATGCEVTVSEPAPDDDLGGVVTVAGPDFDPIQIVNLRAPDGRRSKLAKDAVSSAKRMPGIDLPVVDVPHLVALKLISGAPRDDLDVVELLAANPGEKDAAMSLCKTHRLGTRLATLLSRT